jgi:RNA polymerase sigma-70 factor (ECF subfamily)
MFNQKSAGLNCQSNQFGELYKTYASSIYRLGFRLLGNEEEAKDVAQETFLRLYQSLNGGPSLEKPKSWLYAVAVNYCNDLLKHKSHAPGILETNIGASWDLSPEKEAELQERARLVRNALDRLPRQDRILIVLYLDGLSYTEMAKATGIKLSSVGKTLSRAVEKLASRTKKGEIHEMPE